MDSEVQVMSEVELESQHVFLFLSPFPFPLPSLLLPSLLSSVGFIVKLTYFT